MRLLLIILLGSLCLPSSLLAAAPKLPVTIVAAQSDPAKLATLKSERATNARLHRILAALEDARRTGVLPSKTIDEAQKITGDTGPHGQAVKDMLLRNFEIAERSALLTDDNLDLMRRGSSPRVVSGSFKGEAYEVDHIIPVAEFPQLGNELANLIYLPRTLNRRKSADIKQRALDLAVRLVAAKVLTPEDYERLKQLREW